MIVIAERPRSSTLGTVEDRSADLRVWVMLFLRRGVERSDHDVMKTTAFLLGVVALSQCVGCGAADSNSPYQPAVVGAFEDEKSLSGSSDGAMTLPRLEARYCMRRSIENSRSAANNTFWDVALLVSAGVTGGSGAAIGAGTAVMDDSGTKRDWQIAGTTFVAVGGGLLALRTALNLSELARTQRIAAAHRELAASRILKRARRGAAASDLGDVKGDPFADCVAEDVSVADAFPGLGTGRGRAAPEADAERKVKESEAKREEQESKRDLAAKDVEILQAEVNAAQAELERVTALKRPDDIARAQTELTAKKLDLKNAIVKRAESEVAALRAKQKEFEAKKQLAESKLQEAQTLLDSLQKENAEQGEIQAAKKEVAAKQSDVKSAQRDLDGLAKDLEAKRKEVDEARAKEP